MSCDSIINKRRVDIITGCAPELGVHLTWNEVAKAVRTGETVIRTTMINKTDSIYKDGICIKVGCYSNKLCKLLREQGIIDIRYGSPYHLLNTRNNTYTLYK